MQHKSNFDTYHRTYLPNQSRGEVCKCVIKGCSWVSGIIISARLSGHMLAHFSTPNTPSRFLTAHLHAPLSNTQPNLNIYNRQYLPLCLVNAIFPYLLICTAVHPHSRLSTMSSARKKKLPNISLSPVPTQSYTTRVTQSCAPN